LRIIGIVNLLSPKGILTRSTGANMSGDLAAVHDKHGLNWHRRHMDDDAIRDMFAGLGRVNIRRMFGGKGIYSTA
jgi:hypothetical protein